MRTLIFQFDDSGVQNRRFKGAFHRQHKESENLPILKGFSLKEFLTLTFPCKAYNSFFNISQFSSLSEVPTEQFL